MLTLMVLPDLVGGSSFDVGVKSYRLVEQCHCFYHLGSAMRPTFCFLILQIMYGVSLKLELPMDLVNNVSKECLVYYESYKSLIMKFDGGQ